MKRIPSILIALLLAVSGAYAADTGGVNKETQRFEGKKIFKKHGYTSTTATGNITLYVTSDRVQRILPNGTNRDVTLPAEANNDGLEFVIIHGDGANTLTVKDDGGSTVVTIATGQKATVTCNGSAWIGMAVDSSAGGFLAADGSVAGATGQAQDFGTNGIKADVVAESTGATGVTVDGVLIKDTTVDVNGTADAIILDGDGDTTISAPTANQIDVEIAGSDDFTFGANDFTALSGSVISTDTINETTGAAGVTIDGVLLKDYDVALGDSDGSNTITIASATDEGGNRTITVPALGGNVTMGFINLAQTWSANQTFNHQAFFIRDTADDHSIGFEAAADEAGARTITIPALGGNHTLALLGVAGTWSANQTFNSGTVYLNDTGDDHTINILSAADNAANRTLSIPALGGNDTLAVLGTAQTFTANQTYNSGTVFLNDTGDDHTIGLVSAADNAANRTLSIPALSGNDTLVVLGENQTITGNITHSGSVIRTSQRYRFGLNGAKVGSAAGFTVAAAADNPAMTVAASQTAAKLVVPIPYLKSGATITGFGLVGQVESAGNLVTVDCDLRVSTAAAGDFTDASVSTITQISVNADTKVDSTQDKTGISQAIAQDESYYMVITVTTNASTDFDLRAVTVIVTED